MMDKVICDVRLSICDTYEEFTKDIVPILNSVRGKNELRPLTEDEQINLFIDVFWNNAKK